MGECLSGFTVWQDCHRNLFGNLISIVLSILFAYVTNRIWVFRSRTRGLQDISKELLKFVGGRVITLVIEIGGVQLVTVIYPDNGTALFIGKLITQVIVILLNFIISKVFVFRKGQKDEKVT